MGLESFERLKVILAEDQVIKPYDEKKELSITTDASEYAIGAILSQEHPILYLSRKLTKNELNYSTIEKEALAIVWTLKRAKNFVLGRQFLLISEPSTS